MYRLDLIGFSNQKLVNCKDLNTARAAWLKAKDETYTATSFDKTVICRWSMWELWKLSPTPELVKSGSF